jgi:cytochrome c oxidase subunit I
MVMADAVAIPREIAPSAGTAVRLTMALAAIVLLLMMALGLVLRLAQGAWVNVAPDLFYQIMTAHGAGMVGAAGLAGGAIMWFFLNRYVEPRVGVYYLFLAFFLLGVVFILGGIFLGGFAGAWTFLFPLPAISGGVWNPGAALAFFFGLLCVGVGFLLLYLDAGLAIVSRYGSLARALGWPQLFAGSQQEGPPPTVVASTVVLIVNTISIVAGATVLVISGVNLYVPALGIDALLAKNLIYFFGHVFINTTIYMAVIAVYEIVPAYTGRPWKSNKVFLAGWTATLLLVLAVYPHHLFQDMVMPAWMLVMGQVLSYVAGIPVILVTTYALLTYLHRSGIRWDLASALLALGIFGWAAGTIPAIIDGTISVNKVMHNTLWVPGHFHFYLLLGMVAMAFGFSIWLAQGEKPAQSFVPGQKIAFLGYLVGGLGLVVTFLYAGMVSVPRRWAVHLPEWVAQDRLGSIFSAIAVLATAMIVVNCLARFARAR